MRKFNLRVLLILSFGHLSTDIYQGALPAILPFLKERLSLSYATAGAIILASNFTSSIIQPLFGWFSDKEEKPLFLPLGCLLAGVGFSLLAVQQEYYAIVLLVILSGLGVASYHPEGFRTASFFTGEKAATGMSVFSVGGNLGYALGPVLALLIVTRLGFSYLPMMILPALLFLGLVIANWKAVTVRKSEEGASKKGVHTALAGAPSSLILLIGTVILRSWTHAGLMTYIPFFYIDYLRGDPVYAGKLVSAFLLGGVVGTLAGSPMADRWGHKKYLVISLALTSLLLPAIMVAKGVLLFLALFIIGTVLISSFTVTIVMAQRLLPGNLGIASGLMVGFAIGTGGIGVTVLGLLADRLGVPAALKAITILPVLGLLMAAALKYPHGARAGSQK